MSRRKAIEQFVRGAATAAATTVRRLAVFGLRCSGGCVHEREACGGTKETRAAWCTGTVTIGINENRTVDVTCCKAIFDPMRSTATAKARACCRSLRNAAPHRAPSLVLLRRLKCPERQPRAALDLPANTRARAAVVHWQQVRRGFWKRIANLVANDFLDVLVDEIQRVADEPN